MEKRQITATKFYPSLLGFGCMRFPLTTDGKIDEEKAEAMIDYAYNHGINYFDTAYPYHDGDSEPFLGRVLKKFERSSFYLATKLPIWKLSSKDDALEIFNQQLQRLDVDYVDFYLLHALDQEKWQKILDYGVLDVVNQLKKEGKIKLLGFSFHDKLSVFEKIITYQKWDFCQIQYNYMDTDIQAGSAGYNLATELNIPVVVMEPVKGGTLAALPADITRLFHQTEPLSSNASWALRWVGSHPNVKVILSGMTTLEQLKDNIRTMSPFKPLTMHENFIVDKVTAMIYSRQKNACTTCGYCMPCPHGVNIPRNFFYWNEGSMYQNEKRTRRYFDMGSEQAQFCVECKECEPKCPQRIPIISDLKRLVKEVEHLKES